MKKQTLLAAAMAAFLLLSLAACHKAPAQTPDEPQIPPVNQPQDPTPDPAPPETPQDPDLPQRPQGDVPVEDLVDQGSVEEVVSYQITVPQITLADATAAESVNGYYRSAAGKLADYAWGELYESALEDHSVNQLEASYEVGCNQDGMLSVFRSAVSTSSTGERYVTHYAETFATKNGGLLIADDFFTVDQQAYTDVLVSAVTAQIEAMDQKDALFDSGWETTVRQAFDKDQFYLQADPDGMRFVVFYQEGELGEDAPYSFALPVSDLEAIFQLPQ